LYAPGPISLIFRQEGCQSDMATSSSSSINLTTSVLDVATIVDNLIYADSAPVRNMQSQVTTLQSKVSAYQSLNTKLSALSGKVNTLLFGDTEAPLIQPYSFSDRLSKSIFSKCSVTSSDDSIIAATSTNAASGGSYAITVSSLAKGKSMASSSFSSTSAAAAGAGTISITTGSKDPVTVTIDSTNNTLTGVRDAINSANAGVTATIINDGSSSNPYKLVISANSTGTANAFTISENLSGGQALSFAQTQAAVDAQFTVNGIDVTKSTNTVSDVIDGVTLTLKQRTTNAVTLSVEQDTDSIVTALKDMVTAYNSVSSYINAQFTYNSTSETAGVLAGDSTLRSVQSKLQIQVTQGISNRFTTYGVAGQIGLEFNRDGTLTLDETTFRDALSENPTAIAALFLGDGTPKGGVTATDSRVTYSGKTSATQNGTYAVQVSTLAQQASVAGAQGFTALNKDETLTISSGGKTAVVSLMQDDSFATALSKINSGLSSQGIAATATNDGTGKLKIATSGYGSSQSLTIFSDGDGASGTTGFSQTQVVANGIDIAGTINGHAATGNGLILTGASGQPEEGLSINITQSTAGSYGKVTVASASEGVEGSSILMNLFSALDGITDPLSGPIHNATDALSRNILSLNDNIDSYQLRLDKEKEMLTEEFNAADNALRLLTVQQAQLSAAVSSLSS
jgi:flagellar hook-associated protein 2